MGQRSIDPQTRAGECQRPWALVAIPMCKDHQEGSPQQGPFHEAEYKLRECQRQQPPNWGRKKPINRKHINIFLTAPVGQSSQGRTSTRPRDKRDKMAVLLWN